MSRSTDWRRKTMKPQTAITARTLEAAKGTLRYGTETTPLQDELLSVEVFNVNMAAVRTCRECGCTDNDCRGCIERTGQTCCWVEQDLCSACQGLIPVSPALAHDPEAAP